MEKQQLNSSSLLTRIAEIFENERYQLTTMTWTSKGLLISDRLTLLSFSFSVFFSFVCLFFKLLLFIIIIEIFIVLVMVE